MPEDVAAVMDVGTDDAVDATVDTQDASAADGGADAGADGGDAGGEGDGGEPLRGAALWRETKANLFSGKPLSKAQISSIRRAINEADQFHSKYPDGTEQMEATLEAIQGLAEQEGAPIEQVIQDAIAERTYFRELDDLFTSGNPEFVNKMADASPEAFQNVAPAVFRKYAELNPEGYSAYVAQAAVGFLNEGDVPMQFRLLATFLPQLQDGPAKDQVISAVEAIFGATERLRALAAKKIESKQVQSRQDGGNDRESQIAQREMDTNRRDWNAAVRDEGVKMVQTEAKRAAGGKQLTEKEQQTVLAKVGEELEARLSADRTYGPTMQAYLKAGNQQGYLQRIRSERKKIIPGATKRAVDEVLAARPRGGQQQQKPGQKQNAQGSQQQQRQQQGAPTFRRISGPPKTVGLAVDLGRTPQSMLLKHQAYIKGEQQPVTWARS